MIDILAPSLCLVLSVSILTAPLWVKFITDCIAAEIRDKVNNPEPYKFEVGDIVSLKRSIVFMPSFYSRNSARERKIIKKYIDKPMAIRSRDRIVNGLSITRFYRLDSEIDDILDGVWEHWLKLEFIK